MYIYALKELTLNFTIKTAMILRLFGRASILIKILQFFEGWIFKQKDDYDVQGVSKTTPNQTFAAQIFCSLNHFM